MFEEIQEAALAFENKYQRKADILCIDRRIFEALHREELMHRDFTNPNGSKPTFFGMDVIVIQDENFGYELFEYKDLDTATQKYDKQLYPSSSISVYRLLPLKFQRLPVNPNAKPVVPDSKLEPIDIAQSVIGAYKRYLSNN